MKQNIKSTFVSPAENDSDENSHSGQALKKRTKASAKGTNEATSSERHHWDLIRRVPANREVRYLQLFSKLYIESIR